MKLKLQKQALTIIFANKKQKKYEIFFLRHLTSEGQPDKFRCNLKTVYRTF